MKKLWLSLIFTCVFATASALASVPSPCELSLHAKAYIRLTERALQDHVMNRKELASAAEAAEPVNPLRNQAQSAENISYWQAFEKLLAGGRLRAQWRELQADLMQKARILGADAETIETARVHTAGIISPSFLRRKDLVYPELKWLATRDGRLLFATLNRDDHIEINDV